MVLIDTNILYIISGLEKNSLIDENKLLSFIKTKEVCISPITVFEILNHKDFQSKYSFIIQKTIERCKSVAFVSTSFYSQYFNSDLLIGLQDKERLIQIKVKQEIGRLVIDVFSYFFANLITSVIISFFSVFPFLEKYSLDSYCNHKSDIQQCYEMLFDKEFGVLKRFFTNLIKCNSFTEKERNKVINYFSKKTNFLFVHTIQDALTSLNKGNFSYEKLFNKFKAKIKRIDLEAEIDKTKFKHFDNYTFFNYVMGNEQRLKKESRYIVDGIVDILTKDDYLFNPATDKLYKEYLKQFLIAGKKNKSNDLLDTSLVDAVQIIDGDSNIKEIISSDRKFCELLKRANIPSLITHSWKEFAK